MTKAFPRSMSKLINTFSKMPGIGVRSAERLAFYILRSSSSEVEELLNNITEVKKNIRFCRKCNNLSEEELCSVCSDTMRDESKICVVDGPNAVVALEKLGMYDGLYHVLLGELSPIEGMGPEDIKADELVKRIEKGKIKEVIVATDFTTEGETTALYLCELLKPFKVKVTRLARGVPAGATVEYADVATLQRALEERRGV